MENYFAHNPVWVDVIETDDGLSSVRRIIFAGDADIKKRSPADLKARFGARYASVLDLKSGGGATKRGGDLEIDDIDIDDIDLNMATTVDADVDVLEQPAKSSVSVRQQRSTSTEYTWLEIFTEDRIIDVKEKIQLATGIPVYCQHLYYTTQGKNVPLSYRFIRDAVIRVDIAEFVAREERVMGIPVDVEMYNDRENARVEAFDSFRVIGDVYRNFGQHKLMVIDMRSFFRDRASVEETFGDAYTRELVYASFVLPLFPMCSGEVFKMFIKKADDVAETYPELHPDDKALEKRYREQVRIAQSNWAVVDSKKMPEIVTSISEATISVYANNLLDIRNIFDAFETNDLYPYVRAKVEINNRHVMLTKVYKNSKASRDHMSNNSLVVGISIGLEDNTAFNTQVVLNQNGSYSVHTAWREDKALTTTDMIAVVSRNINPLITYINSINGGHFSIPLVTEKTARVSRISMDVYLKQSVSEKSFNEIVSELRGMVGAGVLTARSETPALVEYIWRTMWKFDNRLIDLVTLTSNQYSHMTVPAVKQKWENLYEKNRLFIVSHRFSDVRFSLVAMQEEEVCVFVHYVRGLIGRVMDRLDDKVVVKKVNKKLRKLKEVDPELYDLKAYGSDVALSKKCQKPLQPVTYSPEEFEVRRADMTQDQIDRSVIKYWNFTTEVPAYYECPSAKYPYPRFITGIHPRGYCIPCCKKTPAVKPGDEKEESGDASTTLKAVVHETCMTKHTFDEGDTAGMDMEKSRSLYVMSYTKNIDVGRLSLLPETTLESLFYEYDGAHIAGIEEECKHLDEARYYILGVEQMRGVVSAGAMYALCAVLGVSVNEYIEMLVRAINEDPTRYVIALDGTVKSVFPTARSLVNDLFTMSADVDWNRLVCDLTEIYLDMRVLVFDDTEGGAVLDLPMRLQHTDNYLLGRQIAILLQNGENYNPIIIAEREDFYRNDEVIRRVFTTADEVVEIISDMIMRYVADGSADGVRETDLHAIELFVNSVGNRKAGYSVREVYANARNMCYAVVLVRGKSQIYVPCGESYFNDKKYTVKYDAYRGAGTYAEMEHYLSAYNKFIARVDGYSEIHPERWLEYRGSLVGFVSGGLHYYCVVGRTPPPALKDLPRTTMLYDVNEVNTVLIRGDDPVKNEVADNEAVYRHYLYQLLLLEFINVIESERNNALRRKILRVLTGTDFRRNAVRANRTLEKELGEKYPDDLLRIKIMINDYVNNHLNRNRLVQVFDNEVFAFDKCILQKLLSITDHKALVARLQLLCKKFVQVGTPKFSRGQFPNMLQACGASEASYCAGKRLVLARRDLDEMLDIMAYDLTNPGKQMVLFSRAFVKTTLDPFNFIKRPFEQIYVAFI